MINLTWKGYRETRRAERSSICDSLPKWPPSLGLDHTEARSFVWVSHVGPTAQELGLPSAFLCLSAGNWIRSGKQPEHKLVTMWNADILTLTSFPIFKSRTKPGIEIHSLHHWRHYDLEYISSWFTVRFTCTKIISLCLETRWVSNSLRKIKNKNKLSNSVGTLLDV